MSSLEQLRLAAAIGHAVPGAELRLRTRTGERLVVGRHSAADLDPCVFRNMVVASRAPRRASVAEHVEAIEIGGSITDTGGGVFGSSLHHREQRWVATLVPPDRVVELLTAVGVDIAASEAMHARVSPDRALDVTVVALTLDDGHEVDVLDQVAFAVTASCLVEELGDLLPPNAGHWSSAAPDWRGQR